MAPQDLVSSWKRVAPGKISVSMTSVTAFAPATVFTRFGAGAEEEPDAAGAADDLGAGDGVGALESRSHSISWKKENHCLPCYPSCSVQAFCRNSPLRNDWLRADLM